MDAISALTGAIRVGWLATLIMDTDEDVSLLDFSVGVFGAGLAEASPVADRPSAGASSSNDIRHPPRAVLSNENTMVLD